jgi:hypothetical protein
LADVLLERRTMTGDDIGVLLSAVTTPRALWLSRDEMVEASTIFTSLIPLANFHRSSDTCH